MVKERIKKIKSKFFVGNEIFDENDKKSYNIVNYPKEFSFLLKSIRNFYFFFKNDFTTRMIVDKMKMMISFKIISFDLGCKMFSYLFHIDKCYNILEVLQKVL